MLRWGWMEGRGGRTRYASFDTIYCVGGWAEHIFWYDAYASSRDVLKYFFGC